MIKHKRSSRINLIVLYLIVLFISLSCNTLTVNAAGKVPDQENQIARSEIIENQIQTPEIKNMQKKLEEYSKGEVSDILQDYDPQNIIREAAGGKFDINLKSIASKAFKYLFNEIYLNLHILIKLLILIILCAILKNLQTSFLSESVGEIGFYVCYIVVVSILLVSFSTAMKTGMDMIENMVGFMYATTPILITLLVSGGSITSGGIFQPVMLLIVETCATFMKNALLPMIFLSTILSIVNNVSEKIQISRLSSMFKQISIWAQGIMLTIFVAAVTIQGSLGAVVDGVTSKSVKFAISTFVPVVGKTLSDAADTVISCTLLIKNAAGLAVLIGIAVICIVPLLKILALVALYKAASALVEPIAEKRITNCISDVAGSMVYIFGVTASVAFMFMITITALISAGNISAMIR